MTFYRALDVLSPLIINPSLLRTRGNLRQRLFAFLRRMHIRTYRPFQEPNEARRHILKFKKQHRSSLPS
jgi:hypothetical protein